MPTVCSSRSFCSPYPSLFPDGWWVSISDNAYRLLRQDLFQRFGPLAGQIPAEPMLVKMPSPSTRNVNGMYSPLSHNISLDSDPRRLTQPIPRRTQPLTFDQPHPPKGRLKLYRLKVLPLDALDSLQRLKRDHCCDLALPTVALGIITCAPPKQRIWRGHRIHQVRAAVDRVR
jgi:hypothetical protein